MNEIIMEHSAQADPPYKILSDIDQRCRQVSGELPKIEDVKTQWAGIGFSIADVNFVSPLGQIQEILSNPEITAVPGAKKWIRGITNNRGNLLPVIDLSAYLDMGPTPMSRRSRVLVIQFGLLTSGLLVQKIQGQRHFLYDEEVGLPADLLASLQTYIEGAYSKGGQMWLLFNMRRLAETPRFIQAAA